jgi:hypothetical protein
MLITEGIELRFKITRLLIAKKETTFKEIREGVRGSIRFGFITDQDIVDALTELCRYGIATMEGFHEGVIRVSLKTLPIDNTWDNKAVSLNSQVEQLTNSQSHAHETL